MNIKNSSDEDLNKEMMFNSKPSNPNHPEWRRNPCRPHLTWLRQMDGHFRGGGIDPVDAWTLAKGDPKAYRALDRGAAKHLPDGTCTSKEII